MSIEEPNSIKKYQTAKKQVNKSAVKDKGKPRRRKREKLLKLQAGADGGN
jgi:hypothetical protein